jgi:DNA-binding transcriptional regulator YiaG
MGGWSGQRGKGAGIAFLRSLIGHDGDACVTWPLKSRIRGYGNLGYNGKLYLAHRLMCELAHGPAPAPDYEAAHSCGRGHHGCVNPKHLSWKTRAENQQDRRRHNTHGTLSTKRVKLTAAKVAEIRALQGNVTIDEMAARFGVSRQNIQQILKGETWVGGEAGKPGFKPGDPRNPSVRRSVL